MCWIRNKIINFVIRFKSWWYTIKWLGVNYTFLSTITITQFVPIWNVIKHRAHGKIQVHVNIMKSKNCRHLVSSLIEKKKPTKIMSAVNKMLKFCLESTVCSVYTLQLFFKVIAGIQTKEFTVNWSQNVDQLQSLFTICLF